MWDLNARHLRHVSGLILLSLALLLVLPLLTPRPASAQSTGSLVGRVTDLEGRPPTGVEIRVEGTSLMAVSDRSGAYRMVNVPAGTRAMAAEALAMQHQRTADNICQSVRRRREVGPGSGGELQRGRPWL